MILIDANLLIYAIDADSPHHSSARPWLEKVLSDTNRVGLAWVVVLAFIRITTHPNIMRTPLTPEQALAYVASWIERPCTKMIVPDEQHWTVLSSLLKQTGTAGNLTTDAHIAALALTQGYTVYSADNDFNRFPGINYINPLLRK